MKTAIIFDCEFLCIKGSQSRFWCAAIDPDPVIAQIGAVKIGLENELPILETFKAYVTPHARYAIAPLLHGPDGHHRGTDLARWQTFEDSAE
ncbi:conserved hypothetical protein [Brucella sp. NVSL 07-0026]|nr:conserved hypothetical protein [Brucella sp. NVSL 07-0026]